MVRELAADHIVLDTITLPVSLPKEALIDKMDLPNRVKIGEPFTAKVVVSSLTAQTATVSLFKDGKPTGQSKNGRTAPGQERRYVRPEHRPEGLFPLQRHPRRAAKTPFPKTTRAKGLSGWRASPLFCMSPTAPP